MKKYTVLALTLCLFGAMAIHADDVAPTAQPPKKSAWGMGNINTRVKRFESRAATLKAKLAKETDADKRTHIEAKIKENADKAKTFLADHKDKLKVKIDKELEEFKKATPAKQAAIKSRIERTKHRIHNVVQHFERLFPEDAPKLQAFHVKLCEKIHAVMGQSGHCPCPTCKPSNVVAH